MASDSLIGSLRVALSLGTADFEAGANKAASVARTKAKEIESAFAPAKAAVEGLFAAFAIGALTEQVKSSLEYAGSLAEVSRTLGLTTKDLQTFRYAASQSGVSQDQLEVGLRRLTVSMGKAELGSKAQQKAFGALGITVADLKGKTTGDIFRMMSDSLSKVTDRSQRAAVEMTLMGRSGSTLDNLLAPGSARLNALAQAAEQLGIVLSDHQIQSAEETAHKLAAVKEVLSAQIAGVVADNAHAILSLSSALASLTSAVVKFLGSNPQLALGIIGGLAGFRLGGPIGGLIGGAAGVLAGVKVAQSRDDANMDVGFRAQQLLDAKKRYEDAAAGHTGSAGVAMSVGGIQTAGGDPDTLGLVHELNRQAALYKQARALASAPKTAPPKGTDLPQFLGGGGKKKKTPEDKTEQDEFEFAQAMRQEDIQILEAKKALAHDVGTQAELALQVLDIQQQIKDAEIDHKVVAAKKDLADKKITQSTYDQIVSEAGIEKAKEAELVGLQRKAILDQRDQQLLQQSIELDTHAYDAQKELLQKQADLAQTATERRKIQLQLLDLDYKEKRIMLERIIAESNDPIAVANARVDLNTLQQGYWANRQGVLNSTRGPLEEYIAKLPDTVAKFDEAVQTLEVQGIEGLLDDITQLQGGFKSLLKSLLSTALQFAQGFARLGLQRGLSPILGSLLGGGQGFLSSGAGNNMFGDLSGAPMGVDIGATVPDSVAAPSLSSMLSSIPGYASGGSFLFRGIPGVDNNVLSMNGLPIAKVSYGERAIIVNDNSPSQGWAPRQQSVAMTVITPNADSFNRSGRQVVRQMQRALR